MSPDEETAADLREAITHLAATTARQPAHWIDRKAKAHARINELLDQLQLIEGWITCESASNQDAANS